MYVCMHAPALEELLGHVGAASLVDDVRGDEHELKGDDETDEEAHAGSGSGDHCGMDLFSGWLHFATVTWEGERLGCCR